MFDISMSCAAFGHCLETDFLISKKGKSLMMVVAGSLPPWVMQPGKNRKKIILPPENISKCLISTVGYVIAEGKIFLLPGGYPSHCPILSLLGRPSMQRCISSPVCPDGSRPNSAPSIKTQLLPDVTNTQPSRLQDASEVPLRNTILQLPGPQTAKVLFAWKKKKEKKATLPLPKNNTHTHTQEKNI